MLRATWFWPCWVMFPPQDTSFGVRVTPPTQEVLIEDGVSRGEPPLVQRWLPEQDRENRTWHLYWAAKGTFGC